MENWRTALESKEFTEAQKLEILLDFASRVSLGGYHELSWQKIDGEYHYFVDRATQILGAFRAANEYERRKRTDSEGSPMDNPSDLGNF